MLKVNARHARVVTWNEVRERICRSHPIIDGESHKKDSEDEGEDFEGGFLHIGG